MSIFGQVIKGTVTLIADGLDYVITKSTGAIKNKYGENEMVQTVSDIGSSTVRVSESTLKTLADVVDGGIEAGAGYISDNEDKKSIGLDRMKTAGKDLVTGFGQGLAYTYEAGATTTTSAVQAGKHMVQGNKEQAVEELAKTKTHAINFAKVVVVGLLAFGPTAPGTEGEDKPEALS